MEIRKTLALQGSNVWGTTPLLEVWADFAGHSLGPAALADVAQRLLRLAGPHWTLADLSPIGGAPLAGPAIENGADSRPVLAGWLEQITRKLQSLSGVDLPPGRVVATSNPDVFLVSIRFEDEGLARPALKIAAALLAAALGGEPYDLAAPLRDLQGLANDLCLGPSTRAIVLAARARGIPVRRLNVESLVQFGYGAQQRRVCTAETDGTGIIAESIAQDKELTKALLRRAGIPVPQGRAVTSAEDAWEAACEVGVPVVVKPRDANHGRGVAIKLSQRERIMEAYEHAQGEGSGVLVEQFVPGIEHRLLVVGNRVVAVSRGEPDQVIGDGVHTIEQLVELANLDPRRGDEYALPMCKLRLDPIALLLLEQQNVTADLIPAEGIPIVIHRNGEYTTDVTDQLHPEVAARAVLAARVVGLDVAGIDLMVHDVSRPLEEQEGRIIEVNAGPGLQMHSEPQKGRPRPVGAAIVDTLFPEGQSGRIPIVALAAAPAAPTAALVAAHLLRQSGLTVGLLCSAGTFVGDRQLTGTRRRLPAAADLLLNPFVEAAVLELRAETVYQEGLAFERCDVVVVEPQPRADAPQPSAIVDSLHTLHAWQRILIAELSATGTVIFQADDPQVALLADTCRGTVVLCHAAEDQPTLAAHRAAGANVLFLRDRQVVVGCGSLDLPVGQLPAPGLPHATAILTGIAAAWAAGVPLDLLGKALSEPLPLDAGSLPTSTDTAPNLPDQPRAA